MKESIEAMAEAEDIQALILRARGAERGAVFERLEALTGQRFGSQKEWIAWRRTRKQEASRRLHKAPTHERDVAAGTPRSAAPTTHKPGRQRRVHGEVEGRPDLDPGGPAPPSASSSTFEMTTWRPQSLWRTVLLDGLCGVGGFVMAMLLLVGFIHLTGKRPASFRLLMFVPIGAVFFGGLAALGIPARLAYSHRPARLPHVVLAAAIGLATFAGNLVVEYQMAYISENGSLNFRSDGEPLSKRWIATGSPSRTDDVLLRLGDARERADRFPDRSQPLLEQYQALQELRAIVDEQPDEAVKLLNPRSGFERVTFRWFTKKQLDENGQRFFWEGLGFVLGAALCLLRWANFAEREGL